MLDFTTVGLVVPPFAVVLGGLPCRFHQHKLFASEGGGMHGQVPARVRAAAAECEDAPRGGGSESV